MKRSLLESMLIVLTNSFITNRDFVEAILDLHKFLTKTQAYDFCQQYDGFLDLFEYSIYAVGFLTSTNPEKFLRLKNEYQ